MPHRADDQVKAVSAAETAPKAKAKAKAEPKAKAKAEPGESVPLGLCATKQLIGMVDLPANMGES